MGSALSLPEATIMAWFERPYGRSVAEMDASAAIVSRPCAFEKIRSGTSCARVS